MKEYITPNDVANEIRMARLGFVGSFLVCEGTTDARLLRFLIHQTDCRLISAGGRVQVLTVIRSTDQTHTPGVLGIVDADFWHLKNIGTPSPNLIVTEFHDFDMILIQSRAFLRLIAEYGSEEKIRRFLTDKPLEELRDVLLERCQSLGGLRLVNEEHNLGLRFESLNFDRFVDKDGLSINIDEMLKTVRDHTRKAIDHEGIRDLIARVEEAAHDHRQLCCGHDVVFLISIGLRRALGSCDSKIADPTHVHKLLRMAFDSNEFSKTALFVSIQEWELRNQPYAVLPH